MLTKHLNRCEDSLTGAVFSHLLHLPVELFWQILRDACYDPGQLPEFSGELLQVDFWPKWDPAGTLRNTTYVEPDVLLRFRNLDLIIEAKRWDDGMQDTAQWRREFIAYANEYGDKPVTVKIIALGGIHDTATSEVRRPLNLRETELRADGVGHAVCPVIMCRWRRLLEECQRMARELANAKYRSAQTYAHQRILGDLVGLFAAHGFQTGKWLNEVLPELPRLSDQTVFHQSLFQRVGLLFSPP